MDIELLREYVELSKTLNFTQTAAKLNLSQPALSGHIMKLEKELGVQLIDRSKPKFELTIEGRSFLETSTQMLNTYDKFINRTARGNNITGRFSVQTLHHVDAASFALLKLVREFRKLNPNVAVDVREALEHDTIDKVARGSIDCGYCGIYVNDPPEQRGIGTVQLGEEEFVIWVDKSSVLAIKEQITPADLAHASIPVWIGIPNDLESLYRDLFDNYHINIDFVPRYCTSREDFFLNQVETEDVVILTKGSENIHSIQARDERVLVPFDPPIFAASYLAFDVTSTNEALHAFVNFIEDKQAE